MLLDYGICCSGNQTASLSSVHLLAFKPLSRYLPQCLRDRLDVETEYGRRDNVLLLRNHKRYCQSPCITPMVESHSPCHKTTFSREIQLLRKINHDPTVSTNLPGVRWAMLEVESAAPTKFLHDCHSGGHLFPGSRVRCSHSPVTRHHDTLGLLWHCSSKSYVCSAHFPSFKMSSQVRNDRSLLCLLLSRVWLTGPSNITLCLQLVFQWASVIVAKKQKTTVLQNLIILLPTLWHNDTPWKRKPDQLLCMQERKVIYEKQNLILEIGKEGLYLYSGHSEGKAVNMHIKLLA